MRYFYISAGAVLSYLSLLLFHYFYFNRFWGKLPYEGGLTSMAVAMVFNVALAAILCSVAEFLACKFFGRLNTKHWVLHFLCIGALGAFYYSSFLVVPIALVELERGASLADGMLIARVISVAGAAILYLYSIKLRNKDGGPLVQPPAR